MNLEQVVDSFIAIGYQEIHQTAKVAGYRAPGSRRVIYLRKDSGLPERIRIVLDPSYDANATFELDGVGRPKKALQHGSNMSHFPKRRNGGRGEIHFGTAIDLHTLDGLQRALALYNC